jgi:hypothetical protein
MYQMITDHRQNISYDYTMIKTMQTILYNMCLYVCDFVNFQKELRHSAYSQIKLTHVFTRK